MKGRANGGRAIGGTYCLDKRDHDRHEITDRPEPGMKTLDDETTTKPNR